MSHLRIARTPRMFIKIKELYMVINCHINTQGPSCLQHDLTHNSYNVKSYVYPILGICILGCAFDALGWRAGWYP